MIKRCKVLSGMLNLRSFTVAELALYANVDPSYVTIVLAREQTSLERLTQEKFGLKPTQVGQLQTRFEVLSRNLHLPPLHAPPGDIAGAIVDAASRNGCEEGEDDVAQFSMRLTLLMASMNAFGQAAIIIAPNVVQVSYGSTSGEEKEIR